MKKKFLAIITSTILMSLSLSILSYAAQWEKQSDGSYKYWVKDKNLDEDSGYYNVHNYRWEQQADGTWKAYHTHDFWRLLCGCMLGHSGDPKDTCPGRLEHEEEWVTGSCYINDNYYLFDENGIMQTNRWISLPEIDEIKKSGATVSSNIYDKATYQYYNGNGAKVVNGIQDGRVIVDGVWYDPSVIPFKEDGRIDIARLDWKEDIPYGITEKIRKEYTPDEILDGFRHLPEYVGESKNSYGVLELKFTDYEITSEFNSLYFMSLHWDELSDYYSKIYN